MDYQIGNQVIHRDHGAGRIIAIDEKCLSGLTRRYYVVESGQLTLWIPIDAVSENSIRPPTESFEFKGLLKIVSSPGESLPNQPYDRKNQLKERMKQRNMVDICRVIRDLTVRSLLHNLNDNDRSVLRRAKECLIEEWELSLGSTRLDAINELEVLLSNAHAS